MDILLEQHLDYIEAPANLRLIPDLHYRGYWFYIDNADLESKTTFGLLVQLFNLETAGVPTNAPLLTLPAGG